MYIPKAIYLIAIIGVGIIGLANIIVYLYLTFKERKKKNG